MGLYVGLRDLSTGGTATTLIRTTSSCNFLWLETQYHQLAHRFLSSSCATTRPNCYSATSIKGNILHSHVSSEISSIIDHFEIMKIKTVESRSKRLGTVQAFQSFSRLKRQKVPIHFFYFFITYKIKKSREKPKKLIEKSGEVQGNPIAKL